MNKNAINKVLIILQGVMLIFLAICCVYTLFRRKLNQIMNECLAVTDVSGAFYFSDTKNRKKEIVMG